MKKINKKLVILIASASILLLAVGISIFAYFSATSTQDVKATTNITDETVIEIASFEDLFDYSKASAYNDKNIVSDSSNRKILKLTANLDLETDIIVTADIHLNLNGKTLNLNDHSLTFKHGYAGCFSMYGGVVSLGTNGDGKITIDMPYASFVTNSMTYNDGGDTINQDECVNILHIDPKYTAYSALYFVGNNIASDINKRVEFKDYDTVHDNSFTITDDKFITSKTCSFNSDTSECCSFIYKDLDLPNHYLSTDVTITYSSSNTNVLDTDGKVTLPNETADVNLTATISHESWENSYSCTFKIHVVNLSETSVKNQVATQLLKSYISDYYHGTDLKINENIILQNYYYEFNHGVKLPLTGLDGSITYAYSTEDLSNNTVNTTSHTEGNAYILEPNSDCFKLVVTYNNSTSEKLNMYSAYVGDRETIARLIINKLYGGAIIYDSVEPSIDLVKYSELGTKLDANTFGYISTYNITGLSYSLKSGSDANTYYDYSNCELTVADGQIPPAKTSYLTVTFTFGSGADAETLDIDLYINYLAESGSTASGFLPYYNLYDPQVVSYMTASFDMPFSFNHGAPYVCYDFANIFTKTTETIEDEEITYYDYTLGMPSILKIELYYNGQARLTFNTYSTQTSLTSQLDSYLSTNNISLSTIASYNDAKYIFTIDAQNATIDSVKMLLLYNYKFNPAALNWTLYEYHLGDDDYITELTSTEFTIDGGLFYNATSTVSNAVQDKNFFAWIYNNFNPDDDADPITQSDVGSDSFIPKSWLSQDVALDKTVDSSLSSVTNYAGIGNLTSITKVNLSGIDLSSYSAVLTSISSMTSVTDLNLSGCRITDISAICTMNSIKVLDVSNNSINDFNGLVKLKNLEEVYVYSNNATTNNPIKGSLGITNLQTYNDLLKNGVAVFNQISSGVPVIYSDSDDYNDYVKLKSIIYQNKLSTEISIESLYSSFRTVYTVSNLALANTGGTFEWGYQTSDDDGNTYDEYTATYFYVNYKFSGNTLTVKYYVDRY